jgi:hypothetical protein
VCTSRLLARTVYLGLQGGLQQLAFCTVRYAMLSVTDRRVIAAAGARRCTCCQLDGCCLQLSPGGHQLTQQGLLRRQGTLHHFDGACSMLHQGAGRWVAVWWPRKQSSGRRGGRRRGRRGHGQREEWRWRVRLSMCAQVCTPRHLHQRQSSAEESTHLPASDRCELHAEQSAYLAGNGAQPAAPWLSAAGEQTGRDLACGGWHSM